jgi:hypothetical protein
MTEAAKDLPSAREQLLQLAGLCAMGVALPMANRVADNAQYLILEDYSATAVLVVQLLFFPGLPILLWLTVRAVTGLFGQPAGTRCFGLLLSLLAAIFGMSIVRVVTVTAGLGRAGIPEFLPAGIVTIATLWLPTVLRRSVALRQFLCLLSAGGLAVPAVLLSSAGVRWQLLGHTGQSTAPGDTLRNPAPIVMVVFDGLNGMSLLNAAGEIDRLRFPAFAELADMASMYRNATTVHPRTDHALPALLTSTFPQEQQTPVEADYPPGLFRRIFESGQFDMHVFEPLTRLCPTELRQLKHEQSVPQQTVRLLSVLVPVAVQMCLPLELAPEQSMIPREWFGLLPQSPARRIQKGLVVYGWDTARREQCEHFVECLRPGTRPGFSFLHLALPHYPWSVLPSGAPCFPWADVSLNVVGLADETWTSDEWLVNQAWDRSLLQTLYADRCLGMILQTLRQQQTLDQTLLIVTADHGMCFIPGASLRDPVAETLPDLLPVPLLIKLPGQQQGSVTDRNVEIVDILPTIADVTGMEPDPAWVGSSLLTDEVRTRKTLLGPQPSILAPDFPQRFKHTERLLQVFGTGGAGDRIGRLAAIPGLAGRRVDEFTVLDSALQAVISPAVVGQHVAPSPHNPGSPFTASLLHGKLLANAETTAGFERPVWLAVAVSGRIVATTRTSTDPRWSRIWTAYVPESEVPGTMQPVELYEVADPSAPMELRRIAYEGVPVDELWEVVSPGPRFN